MTFDEQSKVLFSPEDYYRPPVIDEPAPAAGTDDYSPALAFIRRHRGLLIGIGAVSALTTIVGYAGNELGTTDPRLPVQHHRQHHGDTSVNGQNSAVSPTPHAAETPTSLRLAAGCHAIANVKLDSHSRVTWYVQNSSGQLVSVSSQLARTSSKPDTTFTGRGEVSVCMTGDETISPGIDTATIDASSATLQYKFLPKTYESSVRDMKLNQQKLGDLVSLAYNNIFGIRAFNDEVTSDTAALQKALRSEAGARAVQECQPVVRQAIRTYFSKVVDAVYVHAGLPARPRITLEGSLHTAVNGLPRQPYPNSDFSLKKVVTDCSLQPTASSGASRG